MNILLSVEADGNDGNSDASCTSSSNSSSGGVLFQRKLPFVQKRRRCSQSDDFEWDNDAIATCFQMSLQSYSSHQNSSSNNKNNNNNIVPPFVDWNPSTCQKVTITTTTTKDLSSVLGDWKPQELLLPPWLQPSQQHQHEAAATTAAAAATEGDTEETSPRSERKDKQSSASQTQRGGGA